ncbi:hypothetical protein HDU85_006079 [Gaertneriomyces sp. JEL0708]|nr:hypothetical protein HDU85_006079 [Gaertneriomyces sp. JEL0708]
MHPDHHGHSGGHHEVHDHQHLFNAASNALCNSKDMDAACNVPGASFFLLLKPFLPPSIFALLLDRHMIAFLMALVASMGTFLGGLVVVILARATGADPSTPSTAKLMGVLQAFSAGVMLYITCFDLIPEAVEEIKTRETMLWFFGGVAAFGVLEEIILPGEDGHDHDSPPVSPVTAPESNVSHNAKHEKGTGKDGNSSANAKGVAAATDVDDKKKRELFRTSLITFLALTLHNLPEGLGVYLSGLSDPRLGMQLCAAILLHNIPEGMAVAIPLYAATGNTWSVLWWTMLNGLAEPIGVVVGGALLHSYLSKALLSRCLAAVGGIMACISIHELQPMAIKFAGKNIATTAFFAGMLACFGALEMVESWFGGEIGHFH